MTAVAPEPVSRERVLLQQALRELRSTRKKLEQATNRTPEPVAILGAAARLPGGAHTTAAFWQLLRDGVDAVSPLVHTVDGRRGAQATAAEEPGRWAGLLDRIDAFDAEFFGIGADEADHMDPQQRLVLEVAWEAIEDAGYTVAELRDLRVGVFIGLYGTDYLGLQFGAPDRLTAYTAPGGAHSMAANRLSYLLNLTGPSVAVDTACSSSLVAVHLATRALRAGDCDLAVAAGVNVILSPMSTLVTGKVLPLAPSGRCRTFDAGADGIVRAEGCGVVVLGRPAEAAAPGRRARALIRGTAISHNGRTNGLTAPNPRAQATLLRAALADGGIDAGQVSYLEAHGTGTALGDPIEVDALRDVYGSGPGTCAIGSVKTNFGHQEAAAGITGLIKSMLILEHREVPPHLHLRELNPEISLDGTRLRIPTSVQPLPDSDNPHCAAVSSFGFGGANAHIVLQAAPPVDAREQAAPAALVLPMSARNPAALRELVARYAELLTAEPEAAAAVCAMAALRREHHRYRRTVTADSPRGLLRALRRPVLTAEPAVATAPRVGFVFSGQGSQWAGMGVELFDREPVARAVLTECDAIVGRLAGWSILEQLRASAGSRLAETAVAQPAVAAVQLALDALWRSWGVRPHAVAGHSMGEIVALCAAGALDREQTFALLLRRGAVCEIAAGGAMATMELAAAAAARYTEPWAGKAGVAAVNGPVSTVISGAAEAVAAILAAATADGVRGKELHGGYGFHSPLLEGAGAELGELPRPVAPADGVAVYSTVTGTEVEPETLAAGHWHRNLAGTVLFAPTVEAMAADGITVFVELGPHPVLIRHIGELAEPVAGRHCAVGSLHRERPATRYEALARLWDFGLELDWARITGEPGAYTALPGYPWQHRRHWLSHISEPAATPAATGGDGVPETVSSACAESGRVLPESLSERAAFIEGYLRDRLADALDLDGAEQLPPDVAVQDLGLDSLVVVELKNQAERDLGVRVPLAALLEGGSPARLAEAIVAALAGPGTAAAGGA
ncbi:type I polyketide synthase [Nocardia harenae]|uniref:type I polyketide synthase n=1 Tax=Nocardia harenae TaxID=358707 RepID=UPI00083088D5|nr:type I polyketide synthase [Nocardia harenae]